MSMADAQSKYITEMMARQDQYGRKVFTAEECINMALMMTEITKEGDRRVKEAKR